MSHTHLMESRLKAEMVVKPSALWQHREVSFQPSKSIPGPSTIIFALYTLEITLEL